MLSKPIVTPFPYGDSPLKRENAEQCSLDSISAQRNKLISTKFVVKKRQRKILCKVY